MEFYFKSFIQLRSWQKRRWKNSEQRRMMGSKLLGRKEVQHAMGVIILLDAAAGADKE